MKRTKKLTLEQKKAVSAAGFLPENWALVGQTEFYLKIVHKATGTLRTINRYAILKKGERR